jgi:hypothetical protein
LKTRVIERLREKAADRLRNASDDYPPAPQYNFSQRALARAARIFR